MIFFKGTLALQSSTATLLVGSICLRAVKFLQLHHTGRLHTQYEAQGGATSRADAILIFRGVNLSVVHCKYGILYLDPELCYPFWKKTFKK